MSELEKLNKELFHLIQDFAVNNKLQIVGYTVLAKNGIDDARINSIISCDTTLIIPAQSAMRLRMEKDYLIYITKGLQVGEKIEV